MTDCSSRMDDILTMLTIAAARPIERENELLTRD